MSEDTAPKAAPTDPGPGWRLLKQGEEVAQGDQAYTGKEWVYIPERWGQAHDDSHPPTRRVQTHLQPFRESELPKEAFSYQRYIDIYGMSKRDAKRVVDRFKSERVFLNDLYQVNIQPPIDSPFIHLSIKRRDKAPIHDWRDLQAIKNMLVGPDHEGVELYPAERRLVDTANQYHIWCLKTPGQMFNMGFTERLVHDGSGQPNLDGSVQRPLPRLDDQMVNNTTQDPTEGQEDEPATPPEA